MGKKGKKKDMANGVSQKKTNQDSLSGSNDNGVFWKLAVFGFAIFFSLLHRNHVAFMFESDRHFSHLSDLEREMTFRTEMGLYYSYYKTLIQAPTYWDGLYEITHDNVTEFGHTINTLKRFNLYPEIILAAMFRTYKSFAESLNWKTMECWKTDRGKELPPIVSCEGMGNQFYFYINNVFALAGSCMGVLFLYGVVLSDSLFGGFLVVGSFFFNHGEATRVQWTPPLRESFAYPIWAAQMLLVTFIVKYRKTGTFWSLGVAFLTLSFMLPWQFAQFALTTQVGSLFVAYILDYLDFKTFRTVTVGHLMALGAAFVFLFGNEMLLTSLFLSSLITTQLLFISTPLLDIKLRPLFWLVQVFFFAAGTLGIKIAIGSALGIRDDAHIFDILASKFSNFSNFHTRLYTCAPEFDFMLNETPWKLSKTLVLPAGVVGVLIFLIDFLKIEVPNILWRKSVDAQKQNCENVYNVVQFGAYTIMAVLIMRLKLFFTPHLCLMTALLANHQLCWSLFKDRLRPLWHQAFCVVLIGCMAYEGVSNLKAQWAIMGEYSNAPQEQLFEWITTKTAPDAVFAGAMPTMANVKLSTGRPIANHPHYEDSGIRERTMKIYSIFSRKPTVEVHATLKNMSVNYVVFEFGWCGRGPKAGCSMPEVWDSIDEKNQGKQSNCDRFRSGKFEPFVVAYQNQNYKVLKV